jgi:hypothetical protein
MAAQSKWPLNKFVFDIFSCKLAKEHPSQQLSCIVIRSLRYMQPSMQFLLLH